MDTDRSEEQHDAGAGTFLAALRGEGTTILDRQGRRCSTRLLGAPHLDDIERPVHQVWLRSPAFRGITEADMWLRLAEGLLLAYDQPQPSEAATDQPAATPADVLALVGVRAWAEYEDNTDADDAVICPPTRTLLALVEVREFFRCALTARAICTGPLANLKLPTVERLAEAIAATISQRTNTPPELQLHAQRLTDTMTVAGVEMYLHHAEPTLLRVGDDNLCAISLGKEDEEFADTLRLAVALTSHVALLRAIRLRTIVIYLTESEFDPSELLIHPLFSQTIREAGELGGNTGHNQIRRAAIGLRKKARKTAPASLALRATGRPIYTLTLQLTAHHHSIIATAPAATAMPVAQADEEEELELNYGENDSAMEVDTTPGRGRRDTSKPAIAANLASRTAESHQLSKPQRISIQLERHPSQPTRAGKGKAATTAKIKKKQLRGRRRSDGATRNRNRSKPRLSGTRSSDSEWITDDDAAHPSNSSHR
eukprot:jgi/Tetstr1/459633/TSEL_004989.t1